MRAKINGSEVYLKDDQAPAFSSSINKLTDPSKVSGVTSTTIKVVATVEAKRVLGTEFMAEAKRTTRPTLTIGEQGELFNSSILPLRQDRETIECFAVGGNASWFEYAKATKLNTLDLGESPVVDAAYQQATWTDETDILYFPLIDFGSFEGQSNSYDVTVVKLRPALRISRVLEEAFRAINYRLIPCGRFAEHWPRFIHMDPDAPIKSVSNETNNDTSVVRPALGGLQAVTTTPVLNEPGWLNTSQVHDPNDHFNTEAIASAERYLVPFDTRLSVELRGLIIGDIPAGLDGTSIRLVLYEKTQNIPLAVINTPVLSTGGSVTINETFPDVYVEEGMEVNVGYWNTTGSNEDIEVSDASAKILFIPKTRPYAADCPLEIASCAGDMSVADMITALAKDQFLALVTNTTNRTISLWYDEEYFRKPNGVTKVRDWSERMDHTEAPAKVSDAMPYSLTYRWKEDKDDVSLKRQGVLLKEPGYANADVYIGGFGDDQKITMPYAATAMGYVMGGLRIPIMRDQGEEPGTDSYGREPRILYAYSVITGQWRHDGSTIYDYPHCYFVREDGTHPLAFATAQVYGDESPDQTVAVYGAARHLRMRANLLLEAFLFIRDNELQDFDHGMPTLVDDGSGPAWYYVQEISQHQFGTGKPTKCTLVQIPGKRVSLNPNTVVAPFPVPVIPPPPPPVLLGFNNSAQEVRFVSGGSFVVGGSFTAYGTTSVGRIAKIDSDGSLNSAFTTNSGTGFNGSILNLEMQPDGKILVGGFFTSYNGNACGGIARLNADGTLDTGFNTGGAGINSPGTNYVQDISALPDGTIIVGGKFTTWNGSTANNVVALDATGAVSATFLTGTGFNSFVQETCVDNSGNVLIAGNFSSYKGVSCTKCIRILPDGTKDTAFVFAASTFTGNTVIQDIKVQGDGNILLIGGFATYNSVAVVKLIRLSDTGSLDTAFNTNIGSTITGFGMQDVALGPLGNIYASGDSFHVFDTDGNVVTEDYLGTGANARINDMAIRGDGLAVIVGSFTTVNGSTALRIFSFNIGSFSDFNNDFNDDFNNGG